MKLSVQKFPIYASKEHLVADLASTEIKKVCLKCLADSIPLLGYWFEGLRRVKSDTMSSRTIAPTTEAISVPKVPVGIQPISPTSQPPKNPPMIPTIKLTISPEPLPLTIRLASHPATKPMSKYHNQYIISKLKCYR